MSQKFKGLIFLLGILFLSPMFSGGALSEEEMTETQAKNIGFYLQGKMINCWTPPVGRASLNSKITLRVKLKIDGTLKSPPIAVNLPPKDQQTDNWVAAKQSAIEAVERCQPFELPKEIYEEWKELELNFDPSEMVG